MLQEFPAETGVIRVKKEPAKLEGFYSERARALNQLLALDKALAAKQAAAQNALALQRSQPAFNGLGSQLAIGRLRSSVTFAAPVLTVLAAIALAVVAIASWRAAPATASIQFAHESTDVALPRTQAPDIIVPAQAVGAELPAQRESSIPVVAETELPLRAIPIPERTIANPKESQLARVSVVGHLNINEAQPVATNLQARLGAPVDEPAPAQVNQPAQVSPMGTATSTVRRPIDPPSERPDAAPVVVEQRPADPTPEIRDVIRRYAAAYERLDASAAKELWPSLDERALARAFASLSSQTLKLEPCNIDVTGSSAVASCRGFATYVGRVGNTTGQVQRRNWTFELRKSIDDWQIRSVRFN